MSIHLMGASFLKVPELEIDEKEASKLSDAINRVQEQYDVPILTEKQMAWINLIMVGGAVYGPRFLAAGIRKRASKPKLVQPIYPDANNEPTGVQ